MGITVGVSRYSITFLIPPSAITKNNLPHNNTCFLWTYSCRRALSPNPPNPARSLRFPAGLLHFGRASRCELLDRRSRPVRHPPSSTQNSRTPLPDLGRRSRIVHTGTPRYPESCKQHSARQRQNTRHSAESVVFRELTRRALKEWKVCDRCSNWLLTNVASLCRSSPSTCANKILDLQSCAVARR